MDDEQVLEWMEGLSQVHTNTSTSSSSSRSPLPPPPVIADADPDHITWSFDFIRISKHMKMQAPWGFNVYNRWYEWVESNRRRHIAEHKDKPFPSMERLTAENYQRLIPKWLSELDHLVAYLSILNAKTASICKLANIQSHVRSQNKPQVVLKIDTCESKVEPFLSGIPFILHERISPCDYQFYINHIKVSQEERKSYADLAANVNGSFKHQIARMQMDMALPNYASGILLESCLESQHLLSNSELRFVAAKAQQKYGFRVRHTEHPLETAVLLLTDLAVLLESGNSVWDDFVSKMNDPVPRHSKLAKRKLEPIDPIDDEVEQEEPRQVQQHVYPKQLTLDNRLKCVNTKKWKPPDINTPLGRSVLMLMQMGHGVTDLVARAICMKYGGIANLILHEYTSVNEAQRPDMLHRDRILIPSKSGKSRFIDSTVSKLIYNYLHVPNYSPSGVEFESDFNNGESYVTNMEESKFRRQQRMQPKDFITGDIFMVLLMRCVPKCTENMAKVIASRYTTVKDLVFALQIETKKSAVFSGLKVVRGISEVSIPGSIAQVLYETLFNNVLTVDETPKEESPYLDLLHPPDSNSSSFVSKDSMNLMSMMMKHAHKPKTHTLVLGKKF